MLDPFAGKGQLFVHETTSFWEQLKTPLLALKCSDLYLQQYRSSEPSLLSVQRADCYTVVGNVFVHPSAKVAASAKLGPNVSVAAGARIGPGVRLMHCIVMDDCEIRCAARAPPTDLAAAQYALRTLLSHPGSMALATGVERP